MLLPPPSQFSRGDDRRLEKRLCTAKSCRFAAPRAVPRRSIRTTRVSTVYRRRRALYFALPSHLPRFAARGSRVYTCAKLTPGATSRVERYTPDEIQFVRRRETAAGHASSSISGARDARARDGLHN